MLVRRIFPSALVCSRCVLPSSPAETSIAVHPSSAPKRMEARFPSGPRYSRLTLPSRFRQRTRQCPSGPSVIAAAYHPEKGPSNGVLVQSPDASSVRTESRSASRRRTRVWPAVLEEMSRDPSPVSRHCIVAADVHGLVVIRPMADHSANHRLPSAPAAIPPESTWAVGIGNSVMTPAVVIRPILLAAFSVNQRLPSGAGRDPDWQSCRTWDRELGDDAGRRDPANLVAVRIR